MKQLDAETVSTSLVEAGWKMRALSGFIERVGPLWTRREPDGWAYGLLAGADHTNPAGVVHGGVLATLADQALSSIAWEAVGRRACVTVQLDTHFVAAVRPGEFVEARGRVVRSTASLVFMQGSLRVADVEVATASAVMKVVTARVDA